MNITELQNYANVLSSRHGWDKESLDVRLKYLKSEVEETINEVNCLVMENNDEEREVIKKKLGHELFDVIWNACELANRFDIDLSVSCREKMTINEDRTFSESPDKK